MIPAEAGDVAAIEAFLEARVVGSMFALLNLRAHGLEGDHPYAMRFWLRREGGEITDVLGLSRAGGLMPQCPTGPWADCAEALRGQDVTAVIGHAEQCRPLMAAAGLDGAPATLDQDEPHMLLDMAALQVPEGAGEIVPLGDIARDVSLGWMEAYQREALNTPEVDVSPRALTSYDNYIESGSHVALVADGVPLAMTGFNARLPQIVQIGGVYTPPDLRNRGHARRAVALHLAQARDAGVTQAALFSGSDAAGRAYAAIGFKTIGAWTLALFDGPVRVS